MNVQSPENTPASDDAWNIDGIVAELRVLRDQALIARQRIGKPAKLPSRKAITSIVERLSVVLFPNRLSTRELGDSSIDYFVGHTLDVALRELADEVFRELNFVAGVDVDADEQRRRAVEIVREFAGQLPRIRALLESDIRAAFEGDPAAHSPDEVLACYPGITAMTHHRLAAQLFRLGAPLIARIVAEIAHSTTGVDIHPGAQIAGSFFIDHGTGVVIGETAIIGERVRVYQAVTLGAKRFPTDDQGVLLKGNPRHPIVEDDVVIYAGATILGRVTIGRGSVIGGNVWLTRSVPPNSNVTQVRAREDVHDGGSGI
jgi:serine O-acetyltransferase